MTKQTCSLCATKDTFVVFGKPLCAKHMDEWYALRDRLVGEAWTKFLPVIQATSGKPARKGR